MAFQKSDRYSTCILHDIQLSFTIYHKDAETEPSSSGATLIHPVVIAFSSMCFRALICLPLFLIPAGSQAQHSPESPVRPARSAAKAQGHLPQHPSELYANLSAATRPQWRQLYRPTVTRCLEGRQQAAMGLGAVTADLFLAAQARDSQQVRNLLQDEETIEKTLGIMESMATLRTQILSAADQSDWQRLARAIEKLSIGHRRYFRGQKDEPLADLAYIGQWLRALQTCHAVVIAKALPDQRLAIGDPALIVEMNRRLLTLSDPATETNRSLRLLHKRLTGLGRLWPVGTDPVQNTTERLRRSSELLSDAVGQLIQDEEPAPNGTVAAPR